MRKQFKHRRPSAVRRTAAESLEARLAMHTAGVAFGDAPHLTLSFVPDGAAVGGLSSGLFAKFNSVSSTAAWQEAIRRAFQTWAVETNADIGLKADLGQPLGTPGPSQNDDRFGDIRVGGIPMSSNVLAVAIPGNSTLSGTWVGDVLFNTAADWHNVDEVFAIALHEAGHVFGLEHSSDPASPMFDHAASVVTSLTSADIANVRSLYGQRAADMNELEVANNTPASATRIKYSDEPIPFDGATPLVVYGDIQNAADFDYFYLRTFDQYSGNVTFRLRSAGISFLQPRLSVYRENGTLLSEAISTSTSGDMLAVTIPHSTAEDRYIVRVSAATGGENLFSVGGYSLTTTFDSTVQADAATIDRVAGGAYRFLSQDELFDLFHPGADHFYNDDLHQDDTIAGPATLTTTPGFADFTHYTIVGSLSDTADVDYYAFKSADAPSGATNVMTIVVRSLDDAGLVPRVTVYDRNGNVLPATILVNGGGEYVIQLSNVESRKTHGVEVAAADPTGLFSTGNYQLTILASDAAVDLDTFASGVLAATSAQQSHSLYVGRTQLFHFVFDVAPAAATNTALLATIFNASSQPVYRIAARPGDTRSAPSVLLPEGAYTVQIARIAAEGAAAVDLQYTLRGAALSEPTGPGVIDPTGDPLYDCPGQPGVFCYPGGNPSTDPFWWNSLPGAPLPPPNSTPETLATWLYGDWWSWLWPVSASNVPVAHNDAYETTEGAALTVAPASGTLANDTGAATAPLVSVIDVPPAHGALTLGVDGAFTYEPATGYVGADSFSYRAFNFVNPSTPATVEIMVSPLLMGDFNRDHAVGLADLIILQGHFGAASGASYAEGDLSGDGAVDAVDAALFANHFGKSSTVAAPAAAALVAPVHRPTVATGMTRTAAISPTTASGSSVAVLRATARERVANVISRQLASHDHRANSIMLRATIAGSRRQSRRSDAASIDAAIAAFGQ